MCQFFSDATGVCSGHNWLLAKKSMNVNVRFAASCVAGANLHRSGKNSQQDSTQSLFPQCQLLETSNRKELRVCNSELLMSFFWGVCIRNGFR